MKHVLPAAILLASPALAHEGAHPHAHPHGVEGWVVALALLGLSAAVALAIRLRK